MPAQPTGEGRLTALPGPDQGHGGVAAAAAADDSDEGATDHPCILEEQFCFAGPSSPAGPRPSERPDEADPERPGRRGVGVLMVPIDKNHGHMRTDSLDRARARGAISAFVMTTRTPTRTGVLSSVGVRLSLRGLLLLGILPGGFVV